MEFVVPCLIVRLYFNCISFVSILMISEKVIKRVKGHQMQFQDHHLSVITNLYLHFYWIKGTWAFKHQPVLK